MRLNPQRKFYLIVSLGCVIMGLVKGFQGKEHPAIIALLFGIGLISIEFSLPTFAKRLFDLWMRIGHFLGRINTSIILTVIYFVVMVPLSFIFLRREKRNHEKNDQERGSSWRDLNATLSRKNYLSPY